MVGLALRTWLELTRPPSSHWLSLWLLVKLSAPSFLAWMETSKEMARDLSGSSHQWYSTVKSQYRHEGQEPVTSGARGSQYHQGLVANMN